MAFIGTEGLHTRGARRPSCFRSDLYGFDRGLDQLGLAWSDAVRLARRSSGLRPSCGTLQPAFAYRDAGPWRRVGGASWPLEGPSPELGAEVDRLVLGRRARADTRRCSSIVFVMVVQARAPCERPSSRARPGAPARDAVARRDVHRLHRALERRVHGDLHLHRLEDDERLRARTSSPGRDLEADHRARHRGGHRGSRRAATARPVRLDVDVRRRRGTEGRGGSAATDVAEGGGARRTREARERRVLGEERRGRLRRADDRVSDEPAQERQVRRDAFDARSRRARRRAQSSASSRVGPCAISFAIIGS